MRLIRENPKITQIELSVKLNVSRDVIKRNILKLKNKDLIEREGSNKKGFWKLKDDKEIEK